MRSLVKSIAAASVIVMVSIQPGADAAFAPYSPSGQPSVARPSTGALTQSLLAPYGDAMAGAFAVAAINRGFLPSLFPATPSSLAAKPPVVMLTPAATKPSVSPEFAMFDPLGALPEEPPQVAKPAALPPMGAFEKAPPVVAPQIMPHEAIVLPRVKPFRVEPREAPTRRKATREPAPANIQAINFEKPAGAPFAHTRFCLKYPDECRPRKLVFRGGPIELTAERRQELVRVNAEVNRLIVPTRMNEPVAQEQWVIAPQYGDCNDFAVTKRHELIARGWPARALLLAEVVTTWGEHHLVLVVRTRQGDLVADSLDKTIRNWTKTPYEWVRVESPANPLFWSKIKAPDPDVVAMNEADHQR